MRSCLALVVSSSALLAACVDPTPAPAPATSVPTPLTGTTTDGTTRCQPWGCGANSATVGDGLIFDELDSTGLEANAGGVRIAGVTAPDGNPAEIIVERGELFAHSLDGLHEYRWSALVGTVIRLHSDKTSADYELQIQRVDSIGYWRGTPDKVPFYDIRARKADSGDKFDQVICKKDVLAEDPRWTSVPHMALAFEGDRYHAAEKTVYDSTGSSWFNLACAGTAPAKLHLQRYTNVGALDDLGNVKYPTSLEQRTALLKMFTADYCGTGESFTVDGTPLEYGSKDDSIPFDTSRGIASYEAIWGPAGPICLNTPRIYSIDDVNAECHFERPKCDAYIEAGWQDYGALITANPPR